MVFLWKMNSLETQVGQIFISDKKLSKSFVSLLSEKVPETNAEIFSLVEIPILNPSAWLEYEKLAKLIQTILRKNFRKPNENAFENSIAQINDELASIAASGQTAWVGKTNALLAVRQKDSLFISTTGKIHAYLFRDKQLSDIADSPAKNNPLKTFENFAVGKVAKKDFLIFTTTQLLNYISVERLKDILNKSELGTACQSIATIIKDLADETISFGTFILELGAAKDFDGESVLKFTSIKNTDNPKIITVSAAFFNKHTGGLLSKIKAFKKPKINFKDVNPILLANKAKQIADIEKIKALPKAKKFFLGSALVLIIVLLINLFVAIHIRSNKKLALRAQTVFTDIQTKINDANSAFIYNDKNKAMSLLNDAQRELSKVPPQKTFQDQKNKISSEISELQNSIGGLKTANPTEAAKLSSGSANLIKEANGIIYLINSQENTYTPFSKGNLGQSFTISGNKPVSISNTDTAILYTDKDGAILNVDTDNHRAITEKGKLVSDKGLVFYGSPAKAYTVKPASNQILVSPVFSQNDASNYLKQSSDLSGATDIAIDGSIYILFHDHIKKFTAGNEKSFVNANLTYSDNSKIYANNSWKYIYILDPGLKKVVILDKLGSIKAQYTSDKFSDLKDMVIDESAKTIYLLNGNSLLQFQISI